MDKRHYRTARDNMSDEFVRKQSVRALEEAIQIVGGITKLARIIGTSRQLLYRFKNIAKRGISPQFVLAIERATGGLVDRYQMRPDLFESRRT